METIKSFIQSPLTKRYVRSTLVTFLGAFIPTFALAYASYDLSTVTLGSVLIASLMSGTRLGVKAVIEMWSGQLK